MEPTGDDLDIHYGPKELYLNQLLNPEETFHEIYSVKDICPGLLYLTQVTKLATYDANDLNTLPPLIGSLTNLRSLCLYKNSLSTLPSSFSQLTNLQKLNLSNNNFEILPPEILSLKSLKVLPPYIA